MPIENLGHEHEFEPQFGLPERLPSDEFIVWQGSPDVGALASSAFHFKKLMVYFLFLIGACAWPALESGAGLHAVLQAIKWIAPLALVGLASVWMLAYMTSRTTVYTINLPLKQIATSDVRLLDKDFGDITMGLQGSDRIAWIHLWPSVRPWRISKPEPTMRAIADVQDVCVKLRDAWTQATGLVAHAKPAAQSSKPQANNLQVSLT